MTILDEYGRPVDVPREAIERVTRTDRWENPLTGIGTAADKTTHGRFFPTYRVLDQELTSLYNGSDLVATVVEAPALEKFREGFEIAGKGVSEDQADEVLSYANDELEMVSTYVDGTIWSRLYGGGIIVMGIDDGRMPWEPVDEENIRSVDFLTFVDRRYAYVQSTYSDMRRLKHGKPEIYMVSNAFAASGWNGFGRVAKKSPDDLRGAGASIQYVHESRVIRLRGNRADQVTQQQLAGWDWSVIQRLYDAARQFEHAFDSVGYLLSDASQAVYKLQGIIKAIASGQRQAIQDRAMLMEQQRSVLRGIILDAGAADGKNAESAERTPTPFGGIPDLLLIFAMRFAAAAKMPQTKLFGRSPAGMNATGDADVRNWYDELAKERESQDSPNLKKILRYIGLAKEGPLGGKDVKWDIDYAALWSPTDDEAATTRLKNAQRDDLYLTQGVVKPEEVALGLGEVYPSLDIEEREAVLKAGKSLDPYPNDPDPEPGIDPVTGQPIAAPVAPGAKPGAPGAKPGLAKAKKPLSPKPQKGK